MYHFTEPSILVGVSEIRTKMDSLLKMAKHSKIYVGKRQKPVAVLLPIDQYQKMQDLIEEKDIKRRDKSVSIKDYIPLHKIERKFGLR